MDLCQGMESGRYEERKGEFNVQKIDYGFVTVSAATPKIRVADVEYNGTVIRKKIDEAYQAGVKLLVLPELCVTGYTCSDLFWQTRMLEAAKDEVIKIADYAGKYEMLIILGIPYEYNGKLYNVAAVLYEGRIIGLVPKKHLPNYSEFYEARHFTPGFEKPVEIEFGGYQVLMGTNLLFRWKECPDFTVAVEICEDLWIPNPPSIAHAMAGATVIANLSASDEVTGKAYYRRDLVAGQSARLICAYIYADEGEGESSTDLVFSAHNMIAENGVVLAESRRFMNETIISDIDIDRIKDERRRMTTYQSRDREDYIIVSFSMGRRGNDSKRKSQKISETDREKQKNETDAWNKGYKLYRYVDHMPFVPKNQSERNQRCDEILMLQSMGLKKRLEHTRAKSVVVGISGGLDSTLALLVIARAFDMIKKDRKDIIAVTMPGFGTTDRTYDNAVTMVNKIGATLLEIPISDAVTRHFKAIGHDETIHDVTYENVQARQRTLYLMNLANQNNGFVVGTGDLSELALGWATYNGDHMSMYGVNSSIPKTLVRHLVRYYADTCGDEMLKTVLLDVLDTPVSPELLPPEENGEIAQKTEDLVGPYELHDFFLYYVLRLGYEPAKIYYLARVAFQGTYENTVILKWLKTFYRRFFSQQFKRSCLPDGPKVGTVAVSPRGDLRMPSDACASLWLSQLEEFR